MTFQELGLIAPITRALDEMGYRRPSPIQEKAIPPALEGRDVLGCAQTGTGETCAFAAPILQQLSLQSKSTLHTARKSSLPGVNLLCFNKCLSFNSRNTHRIKEESRGNSGTKFWRNVPSPSCVGKFDIEPLDDIPGVSLTFLLNLWSPPPPTRLRPRCTFPAGPKG